jgi:hypothetical protein
MYIAANALFKIKLLVRNIAINNIRNNKNYTHCFQKNKIFIKFVLQH